MSEQTAVALRPTMAVSAEAEARKQEARARNAMVTAIRGQMWSKDLSEMQMRSIGEYCHRNGLDPVRHIEVLGGRIYPTATLYEERAAPYIQDGTLIPHEPDHINADPRLDALASAGDAWAIEEQTRRMRERIKHNVPEQAQGAVIARITVASTGKTVVGVNWCGKGLRMKKRKDGSTYDDDPVGGSEPSKTAITRAGRRAWKQVVAAVPQYGQQFERIEAQASEVSEAIVEQMVTAAADLPRLHGGATVGAVVTTDPSGHGDAMPSEEELARRMALHRMARQSEDDSIEELPGSLPMTERAA
jgi:hypothetical protein